VLAVFLPLLSMLRVEERVNKEHYEDNHEKIQAHVDDFIQISETSNEAVKQFDVIRVADRQRVSAIPCSLSRGSDNLEAVSTRVV
jgi:hypothetical protein